MRLSEKILLLLSRNEDDCSSLSFVECNPDNALYILCDAFPDFIADIQNKAVLDFGCGAGLQALALAEKGASRVVGIETNKELLERAGKYAETRGVRGRVEFKQRLSESELGKFDIVISQNSMEHFRDPLGILCQMKEALNEKGRIYILFGPPWFAPYGSHMEFFTKIPWVNLLFPEETVMNVRARFREDGAMKYEDVKSGLNKMSVDKFERITQKSGLKIRYKKYQCLKRLDFLGKIPHLRELAINQINCVLVNED